MSVLSICAKGMDQPRIEVLCEPKPDLRYRYECERNPKNPAKVKDVIKAEKCASKAKKFPTIKIHNVNQEAVVVASCVSSSAPFYPHPHCLVGANCWEGIFTVTTKHQIVELAGVGIQRCRQKDLKESLEKRQTIKVDPFGTGFGFNAQEIDLDSVRLCFQVFILDKNRKVTGIVPPVVTQEIVDKRCSTSLKICRLSRQSASAQGGEELVILCDKVKSNDIQVRFFQTLPDGTEWEGYGLFPPSDCHKQVAIVCTTPSYSSESLSSTEPASAWIQLYRPSDGAAGEPKPFQFIPNENDWKFGIPVRKRQKAEQLCSFTSIPETWSVPMNLGGHSASGHGELERLVGHLPTHSNNLPVQPDILPDFGLPDDIDSSLLTLDDIEYLLDESSVSNTLETESYENIYRRGNVNDILQQPTMKLSYPSG